MGAPHGNRNAAGKHNLTGAHKGAAQKRWNSGVKNAQQWIRDNSVSQPGKYAWSTPKPRSTSIGARQFLRSAKKQAASKRMEYQHWKMNFKGNVQRSKNTGKGLKFKSNSKTKKFGFYG
jgi:hypothetical protein